jgi:hypothetical protein
MGFLDKLIGRKPAPAPSVPAAARPAAAAPAVVVPSRASGAPVGPLRLQKGDFVTHYRDRFAVVGHRLLEGDGPASLHYCLRDKDGAAAVLCCDADGLSLQRAIKAELKWDADVLTGIGDDPLRVVKKGRVKARGWDDSGLGAGAATIDYRRFADPSGDIHLCLDEIQGRREVRLGGPVYEAELEFERGAGSGGGAKSAAMSRAKAFEEAKDEDVARGSPRAAAKALEQNMGTKSVAVKGAATASQPSGYDDDKWIDAIDDRQAEQKKTPRAAPARAVVTNADDEDDEWTSASQLVRQGGAPIDDDDDDPGLTR